MDLVIEICSHRPTDRLLIAVLISPATALERDKMREIGPEELVGFVGGIHCAR
jgi:hypothetical protein